MEFVPASWAAAIHPGVLTKWASTLRKAGANLPEIVKTAVGGDGQGLVVEIRVKPIGRCSTGAGRFLGRWQFQR